MSKEEIENRYKKYEEGYKLLDVNMVYVMFATTMETIERILPAPLEPADTLVSYAFIAEYQRTNFIPPYNEAGVFIPCQYKGEAGAYCVAMPVTTDIAMIGGREVYGYPKKIAESITLTKNGNEVHGKCVRNGFTIIEINGVMSDVTDPPGESPPHFLIKSILDEKAVGARENPFLVRQANISEFDKMEIGDGTLTFGESKYDYISEIPVVQVMAITYMEKGTIIMPPGKVVTEIDAKEYTPYHGIKYDWVS
jgi:acetoacetate decarboxylase